MIQELIDETRVWANIYGTINPFETMPKAGRLALQRALEHVLEIFSEDASKDNQDMRDAYDQLKAKNAQLSKSVSKLTEELDKTRQEELISLRSNVAECLSCRQAS